MDPTSALIDDLRTSLDVATAALEVLAERADESGEEDLAGDLRLACYDEVSRLRDLADKSEELI